MNNYIRKIREIRSLTPREEIWKLLHYFYFSPVCEERIREIHGIAATKQKANISKQAEQIGFCLRQAEQYFQAASKVGLATRPVLVYYGATSLSQAVVLLRGSGIQSFDKRRIDRNHNHHGLEIKGVTSSIAKLSIVDFLTNVGFRVHESPSGEGGTKIPWGQFPLFYDHLIQPAFAYMTHQRIDGEDATLNRPVPMSCADIPNISKWLGETVPLIKLFADLPDIYQTVLDMKIGTRLSRGDIVESTFVQRVAKSRSKLARAAKPKKGKEEYETRYHTTRDFFVNDLSELGKKVFAKLFKEKNSDINLISTYSEALHFRWKITREEDFKKYFPDVVDNIAGQNYFISDPDNYMIEPASYFAILYCLSMLARYHPDIWIKTLEANIQFKEMMNSFLDSAIFKFPILILDQMTATKHVIRTAQ